MDPVLFNIGGFEIRWYSIMLLIAFIFGVIIIEREAKRFDIPKDFIFK